MDGIVSEKIMLYKTKTFNIFIVIHSVIDMDDLYSKVLPSFSFHRPNRPINWERIRTVNIDRYKIVTVLPLYHNASMLFRIEKKCDTSLLLPLINDLSSARLPDEGKLYTFLSYIHHVLQLCQILI